MINISQINSFWVPLSPNGLKIRSFQSRSRNSVVDDYASKQLTINRIRDCALQNKNILLKTMNSVESWTWSGKQIMDQIVEQLAVSSPIHHPATNILLNGQWVRQGVLSKEVHYVKINGLPPNETPTVSIKKTILYNLVALWQNYTVIPIDQYSYAKEMKQACLSLCGVKLNLPIKQLKTTVSYFYLDGEFCIFTKQTSNFQSPPQVFLKFDEGSEQLTLSDHEPTKGISFIGQILWRVFSQLFRRPPAHVPVPVFGSGGLIGDINWERDPSIVSDEDLLQKAQSSSRRRTGHVVVGDLLSKKRRNSYRGR